MSSESTKSPTEPNEADTTPNMDSPTEATTPNMDSPFAMLRMHAKAGKSMENERYDEHISNQTKKPIKTVANRYGSNMETVNRGRRQLSKMEYFR